MLKRPSILTLTVILAVGAAAGVLVHKDIVRHTHSLPGIVRLPGDIDPHAVESTPLLVNGRVVVVVSLRNGFKGTGLQLTDFTGNRLNFIPWAYAFASAVVDGDDIVVFGSSGRDIGMLRLNASFVPTGKTQVVATLGQPVANTSVTWDGQHFVMAVEVEAPAGGQFHPIFLQATELAGPWTPIGLPMFPHHYTACPTIRFLNGWFYIFYLESEKLDAPVNKREYGYFTRVARTRDFVTYQTSRQTVLSYRDSIGVINTSDLDMVEVGGEVFMTYNAGAQVDSDSRIRRAVFEGTLADLVNTLF